MMQLRHLRYFVATVDCGTVSAAAVSMHVTQPALSRQLRQLETDLGVSLFDRAVGRLAASRTGAELLPRAREILAAADALQADAAFHARGGIKRLTIAAPTVTLTDIVSPFVATMEPEDPVIDVRAGDGLTTTELLRDGADLAIGTQRPQRPLRSRELAVLPVWAYVPLGDPWSARARVGLDELLTRPVIGLPETFTARQSLETAVARTGGTFVSLVEAANGTIAQALAAAGRGVAVVSDDPRYGLVPLRIDAPEGPVTIRLLAAWDGRSLAAAGLADLARRLGTFVAERYAPERTEARHP